MVSVAVCTGLGVSELIALRWSDNRCVTTTSLSRHINSSNNSAGSAFINATLQVTTTAEVYEQDLPESQFKAVEKLNTLVVIENGSGTVTGQRDF